MRNFKSIFRVFLLILMMAGFHSVSNAQTTISTDTVLQTSTCPGGQLIIYYTVSNGSLPFGTTLHVEFSDALGNWDNPDTLATTSHFNIPVILTQLPDDAGIGFNFRVRVVAENPHIVGSQSPLPIFITAFPGLADIDIAPQAIVCGGDMVELTAGAGAGNYRWSNGATTQRILVEQTGTYSVTVSDLLGLCEYESDRIFVGINPDPQAPEVTILGNVLVSSQAESYQWYIDGQPVPGATARRFRPDRQYGFCTVEATDEHGCVNQSTAINLDDLNEVFAYPNPVSDILTIDVGAMESNEYFWRVISANGEVVEGIKQIDNATGDYIEQLDLSNLMAGLYVVQVYAKGGVHSFHIIKTD